MSYYAWNWSKSLCAVGVVVWYNSVQAEQLKSSHIFQYQCGEFVLLVFTTMSGVCVGVQ